MENLDYILLNVPEDKSRNVTISTYEKWRDSQKVDEISEFVYERLYRRYVKIFEYDEREFKANYKNGFSMMANSCLLIETIESFYRGWDKSQSELAFLKFFTRDRNFIQFSTSDILTKFYKHIRCGILHQGETTGGWKITRNTTSPLLDTTKLEINANKFLEQIRKSLEDYKQELKTSDWQSTVWANCKKKMSSIVNNCKKYS